MSFAKDRLVLCGVGGVWWWSAAGQLRQLKGNRPYVCSRLGFRQFLPLLSMNPEFVRYRAHYALRATLFSAT